jgi:hypothetical protein
LALVHGSVVAQDSRVRVACWVLLLCTALGAVGVFLPSVEIGAGAAISRRTRVSLYTASSERETVRRLLAAYHMSGKRELGGDMLRTASSRVGGRLRGAIEDARDAMATLDEVSDDDVRTAGTVFTVTLWALLALEAAIVLLVLPQVMRRVYRRGRLVAALIAAAAVAAIAIALHAVCRETVWQANDELGVTTLRLAVGAYVIPLAAIAGLAAAALLVLRARREAVGAARAG